MKKGWELKKLSSIYQIGSSKRVLKSQWKYEGIPFYRGREVTRLACDGHVDNELFISEKHFEELSKQTGVPQAGDIVLTAIGTIGNSYVVQEKDKFYFKDASVLWMKRTTDVNSIFINYWLKSSLFYNQLDRGNGATVDTLTIKKLQSVEIALPPLAEQKRIVVLLVKAFAAIDKAKANAEKNLANAKELFDCALNNILYDKKWKIQQLGSVCEKVEYGTSSKSQKHGNLPVLRMGNIQSGRFVWDSLVYSNNEDDNDKYLLQYNDVLFNRTNSPELVGKTAIYKGERPAIFAGYLIRIHRKTELLDADYLNLYLNSKMALDYGKTVVISSVNQANINGSKLKTYPIPLPSLQEQKEIVRQLSTLSSKTHMLETLYQKKIDTLDELKKSILKKAFDGEL